MPAFPYADPADYDIPVKQGTSFARDFTWNDPDGTPYPLESYGCHARLQVRLFKDAKTTLLSVSTEFATPSHLTIEGGTVKFRLSSAQTSLLKAGDYVWDLEIVDPNEEVEFVVRLLEGAFTVDREVTR